MKTSLRPTFLIAALALGVVATTVRAQRTTLSLDGTWEIAESRAPDARPARFAHRVEVPGLVNTALPRFPQVDEFDSFERLNHDADRGTIAPGERIRSGRGISRQPRDYFWYRRTFVAPARAEHARLRIAKAQFGTAVWLNGQPLGEHLHCFTSHTWDASAAIRWDGENELVVRIGAHPGVLPETIASGQDGEKNRWTPGIYDRVTLLVSGNPTIEGVQVAPRLADDTVIVQTRLRNRGVAPVVTEIAQVVRAAGSRESLARAAPLRVTLAPGEERTIEQSLALPAARRWSPEDPFLHVVETSTGGDRAETRFGMREFRFDRASGRALLNGKSIFLRGSNITLHRFLEDPLCGKLPWDEAWVHRLLVTLPRELGWNSFRFCIGPVPERWLEIADETGLLIQNEYFYWTKRPTDSVHRDFDTDDLIVQYRDWMRDTWNHPSVVIFDSNNESIEPLFAEKILPAVRPLDLSNRPWDNGWNPPLRPDDPVEEHLYEFNKFAREFPRVVDGMKSWPGRLAATRAKFARDGNPRILNEYGWIWVNRDGTPTQLTERWYDKVIPSGATAAERIEWQCYLLGGVTELWRSTRLLAGVHHFVFLTSSDPKAYTADHFRDVRTLELHPPFLRYMREAFRPLGVYVDFWEQTIAPGRELRLPVTLTNDHDRPLRGALHAELRDGEGRPLGRRELPFAVEALGQAHAEIAFPLAPAGTQSIVVVACPEDPALTPTESVRHLNSLVNPQ